MTTNPGSPTPRKPLCEIRASDGFGPLSASHRQAARRVCIDASAYWRSNRGDLDSHAPALPAGNEVRNTTSIRTELP